MSQSAFITGATSGIGYATAKVLASGDAAWALQQETAKNWKQ